MADFVDGSTVLPFNTFLLNTIIITVLAVLGDIVSCVLPAYAFARLRPVGEKVAFALMLRHHDHPVRGHPGADLHRVQQLGMVNTFWPLVLPAWFRYACSSSSCGSSS